jgi:hypothetical protein
MVRSILWLVFLSFAAVSLHAQSFEVVGLEENYKSTIGETVKVPIQLKNTTDKPLLIVIRKVSNQIGSTQKTYFCIDNTCLDQRVEDYIVKVEPGQTLKSFQVALDAGLSLGPSSANYVVFNKLVPSESLEFDLNFSVDERPERLSIYVSDQVILYDVYPNPVKDHAFAEYKVLDERTKAKLVIHNILGNTIDEYGLPFSETKVKIRAESMNSGVYFYTLYVNNVGTFTQKFIVKSR